MPKAFTTTCFFFLGFIPVTVMTVLYSRVVYSLWFKREESELENTRQVQYERSIAYIRKKAKENKHVKNRIVKCDANLIYSGHAHSSSSTKLG